MTTKNIVFEKAEVSNLCELLCQNKIDEILNPELPIGILMNDGTIRKTSYQLKNIHEFVKVFYLTNMD